MSEILLSGRPRCDKLVNPDTGERSAMTLLPSSSQVQFVAYSRPVKLLMFELVALSPVNVAIASAVIVPPGSTPKAFSIAARRLESGMSTACAVAVNGRVRYIRNKVKYNACFVIDLVSFTDIVV